jgi:hypothetical protein
MLNAPGPHLGDARRLLPRIGDQPITQRKSTLFKGFMVILIAGSGLLLRERFAPSVPRPNRINEANWDIVSQVMSEKEVTNFLGDFTSAPSDPDWPRFVGEIPKKERLRELGWDEWSRPVQWKMWKDARNPDRWIAVAFIDHWGSEGEWGHSPQAIARRKGGF